MHCLSKHVPLPVTSGREPEGHRRATPNTDHARQKRAPPHARILFFAWSYSAEAGREGRSSCITEVHFHPFAHGWSEPCPLTEGTKLPPLCWMWTSPHRDARPSNNPQAHWSRLKEPYRVLRPPNHRGPTLRRGDGGRPGKAGQRQRPPPHRRLDSRKFQRNGREGAFRAQTARSSRMHNADPFCSARI
ncbi:hypothetical protein VUR80DRAFT_9540 [Thermomyces stellatus]